MDDLIMAHRDEILRIAAEFGGTNVRLFGSFARGEATDESDVDLLVEYKMRNSGFDIFTMQEELTKLLGRSVDVLTEPEVVGIMDRIGPELISL